MFNNEEILTVPASDIQSFYDGKTVFITGGSGFLGRLLIEKLLRSCKVKHIYLLMREKKGKSAQDRFNDVFDVPVYDVLKSEQPNFLSRITMVEGELILPNLGLSEFHQNILMNEVNCIFHIGATVRFDEKIRKAAHINVRGVRDLIRIAKDMKQLESFVHVSTAYSNCPRQEIDEVFYEPEISGEKLLSLVDLLNERILDQITPTLLGGHPNTYVFTKAIAEDMLKTQAGILPIVVVRPSIVISTYKEPIPGWIDNMYGPTSILIGAALGLLRSLHGNCAKVADLVPADFVINILIAAAWEVAKSGTKLVLDQNQKAELVEPKIYNYVSSVQNPLTWGEYRGIAEIYARKVPTPFIIWHYWFNLYPNYYLHWIITIFTQTMPAYIVDFLAKCIGKKPFMVDAYKKIDKFCGVISYFTMRQWTFNNLNTQNLWKKLNPTDKEIYNFDIASMTWLDFFGSYLVGARLYLLKDPLDTLPQGRRKMLVVQIGHYTLVTLLCYLLYKLVIFICYLLF